MEISDLVRLIDLSIEYFFSKISTIIDEIVNSNVEAKEIHIDILTQELINQLYKRTFSNPNFKQQLVINTLETQMMFDLFDSFVNAPGLNIVHHQFKVPYPSGRIIGIYMQQHPKISLFSLTKELFNKPEFKVIQEELVSNHREFLDSSYNIKIEPEKRAMQFIRNLIFINLINYLRGKLTDSLKQRYAEVFLNELYNKPQYVHYLATLSGFAIYQDVSLGKDSFLKKYDNSDFDDIDEFAVLINQEEIHLPNYFILKIKPKLAKLSDLFKLENHMLTIIRLFTFGEVYLSYRVFFQESVIKMKNINKAIFQHKKSDYIWTLPENCKDKLTDFATTMLPILQKKFVNSDHKGIQFALERFDWSMRDDIGIERRLLFAVMGLEPLYLPEYSAWKRKKLSDRISKLLEEFDFNYSNVKSDVKKAYKYRNLIVHGSKYPRNWNEELSKLYPKILNYLRVSIVFFLLNLPKSRDETAELIKEAVTSDAKKRELQKAVKNIKKQFSVCFEKHHHTLL